MKRRSYLAGLGTAGIALTAGCGFAHAGGALREEDSLPSPTGHRLYDRISDRFIIGRSGTGWVRNAQGELSFETHTSIASGTREGIVGWRTALEGTSDALAACDLVYLLQEDRIVAIEPGEDADPRGAPALDAATVHWSIETDAAEPPLAAADGGVYLRRDTRIARMTDGEELWAESLPGAPLSLHADDDGVIALTATAVVCFDRSGDERWAIETDGEPSIDCREDAVAIRDDGELQLVDRDDGTERWRESIPPGGSAPRIGKTSLAIATGQGIERYDRKTGERDWRVTDGHRPRPVLIPEADSLYAATGNGTVLAVEEGEVRWRWSDTVTEDPLAGWVDTDRVAFLYGDGTIRRFQRRDEEIPLFV